MSKTSKIINLVMLFIYAGCWATLFIVLPPFIAYKLGFTSETARLITSFPGFLIVWFVLTPWAERKEAQIKGESTKPSR